MSWVFLLQIYLVFYAMDIAHAEGIDGSVALDGDTLYSGQVLLCKDGEWRPVCNLGFGKDEIH